MRIRQSHNAEDVRHLFTEWEGICRAEEFGFSTDIEVVMADLAKWLASFDGVLLVAEEEGEAVGFLAIFAILSNIGGDRLALEKYWFAREGNGLCGAKLFLAAKQWAEENGCSHLVIAASNLSSSHYENVVRFCENAGMGLFETTYVLRLGDDKWAA